MPPTLYGDYSPNFNLYLLTPDDDFQLALLAAGANFGKIDSLLSSRWKGAYNSTTQYGVSDIVSLGGSSYVAQAPVIGIAPPAAPWVPFALKGDVGPSNDIRIGTTLGLSSFVGGSVALDFDTPWGVDSTGAPYWDTQGAAPGEEYILLVEPDGALVLTRPGD